MDHIKTDLQVSDGRDGHHDQIFQSSAARESGAICCLRDAAAGKSRDGIYYE